MSIPLQPWPKIPRAYGVTRYDRLAEALVQNPTVVSCERECQVVERVFGLNVKFENGTGHWLGRRILSFETSRRTNVFRLLAKMWRTHGLLRISPDCGEYRDKLATAIKNLEEAFLDAEDCLDQAAAQARTLLDTCPQLPPRPHRTRVQRLKNSSPILLKGMDSLKRPPAWRKGF